MKATPTGEGLRHYRSENVHEMALRRIRWVFNEFPNVIVSVSGGKDSTVLFHLALEVARELDRLPLKVYWIDQEAEWQATVDLCEQWMTHPDVEPLWLQVPFRIFNATSATDHWLHAWDPEAEDKWVHGRSPIAITDNVFGTDRFHKLFDKALEHYFGEGKACSISGVRTEEARTRAMGLTHYSAYKWVTWAAVRNKRRQHFTFHPLYDWSYTDIWKAILDNAWPYNRVYDAFYQYGYHPRQMRVSNLHHETAVQQLFVLQEVEPETYEKLVARVEGIDSAGKFGQADYFPRELPWMFSSWVEYRDHLLKHLAGDYREQLGHLFELADVRTPPWLRDKLAKVQINSILTNDWEGEKFEHFIRGQAFMQEQRRWRESQAEPASG